MPKGLKHLRALLASAIAASICVGIPGCATLTSLGRPEVLAVRPRVTGIDFHGVSLAFDVDVRNPYPVPIKTPNIRYGIDIEKSKFIDSEVDSAIDLPAANVGTIVLPVRLSYLDLWRTYEELSNIPEANYRLHGALVFNVLGRSVELPISHEGTFPILRPPVFSDIRLRSMELSFAGTRISIESAIRNPNIFSLDIRDLGYALRFGGTTIGNLTARTDTALEPGETSSLLLSGEISAADAISSLIRDGNLGSATILPSGSIQTPYGAVRMGH